MTDQSREVKQHKAEVVGHTVQFVKGSTSSVDAVTKREIAPHFRAGLQVRIKGQIRLISAPIKSGPVALGPDEDPNAATEKQMQVFMDLTKEHPLGELRQIIERPWRRKGKKPFPHYELADESNSPQRHDHKSRPRDLTHKPFADIGKVTEQPDGTEQEQPEG